MKKNIFFALLLVFALAQFIRPARNQSAAPPGAADLATHFPPPAAVQHTLERACYDCHSDNTRYPWYANVQPVAWWLARHVSEGKRHLNFNAFLDYTPKRQLHRLHESIELIEKHEMPLPSYLWQHPDAKLDATQIAALRAWFEDVERHLSAQS